MPEILRPCCARLANRIRMERAIIRALTSAMIKRGYDVTVDNGEDRPVKRSVKVTEVMREIAATDEEYLIFAKDGIARAERAYLVYGNDGYDVVCDYTCDGDLEEVMNEINKLGDRLEARYCR